MTIKQIQEYAEKTHRTIDTEYNRGRKDCIQGYTWTKDARYFMLVENIEANIEDYEDLDKAVGNC